jgi:DNA polymerase-3 subunit gamma/tau
MAYLVLARKYRPQTFEDVVGQQHVTLTLTNAIRRDRVAHAILLAGPRGTGKTTIARILAKAMNCESGPVPTPCNSCRSCRDITAGRGADVFEIDGASNNSVDHVRELRDNIRYMPVHSRYKIYIIDEVHMLSIAAFNALLKTLEEPPAHVMFFFATTEAHKIPITILSRCQRHDLKRIDLTAIADHMAHLCDRESVSVSSGNLWAIARESGGSMRDALSLLDQILASGDGRVGDDDVMNLLGNLDRQVLADLSAAVFERDISRILEIVDTAFNTGQDLKRFYADLLSHFRHLMLIKMDVRSEMLTDLAPTEIEALSAQVAGVSLAMIDQVYTLLFDAENRVRHASQPRLAIEMAFFKIYQIVPALPIEHLIERVDSLLQIPLSDPPSAGIVESQTGYDRTPPPVDEAAAAAATSAGPDGNGPAADAAADDRPPAAVPIDADPWEAVLTAMAAAKPSIASALSRSQLISISDTDFTVRVCDNDYTVKLIKKHMALIETLCRQHAGRGIRMDVADDTATGGGKQSAKRKAHAVRQKLLNHPLVADAVDIFNGKIESLKVD